MTIVLRNNLVCGNRLGELAGPVLDVVDGANLTPTGAEGPGVVASPGCEVPAIVYRDLAGADHASGTLDDDPTPASGSPLIDRGLDPRTLLTPDLNARFEADYFEEAARPVAGSAGAPPRFDIGAVEARRDTQPPAVAFLAPPVNAHLRGVVSVKAQASDATGKVSSLTLRADSRALAATLDPAPPAPAITASASWDTSRQRGRRPDAHRGGDGPGPEHGHCDPHGHRRQHAAGDGDHRRAGWPGHRAHRDVLVRWQRQPHACHGSGIRMASRRRCVYLLGTRRYRDRCPAWPPAPTPSR